MTQDAGRTDWVPDAGRDATAPAAPSPTTPAAPLTLSRPESVSLSGIRWIYAVPIVAVHVAALAAFVPWCFTWAGFIAFLIGVPFFGQGINLCYHRLLTHRSFQVPRWFEHALVLLALCTLEDTPICWVTTHRLHHVKSDERQDPHSPWVTFLWGHVGWLMFANSETHSLAAYQKYARDLVSDRFYRRLEANPWLGPGIYLIHAGALVALAAGIGMATGSLHGAIHMGVSMLVWGVILRTVVVWHITWSVNSVSHLFGYRSYETQDHSRNNWLVGLIGAGEGWHNNHHEDPTSATVQHRWWEIDPTYYVIKVLSWVGLATEIVPPRGKRVAKTETPKA